MKISEVFKIVAVFWLMFAIMVIAYGLDTLFDNNKIAMIFGIGISIFSLSMYFYHLGKRCEKKENIEQIKDLNKK